MSLLLPFALVFVVSALAVNFHYWRLWRRMTPMQQASQERELEFERTIL